MTDRDSDPSLFRGDLYKEAVLEIGTLREKLPESAFEALAREVIRRLSDHPVAVSRAIASPTDAKIEELAHALMESDADAGIAFIEHVQSQGASVETVYLSYLAQAAKLLGQWWEDDKVSFVEVTVATGHIYAVMRGLKPRFQPDEIPPSRPAAFFAAVPGETHLLGVSMAADLFRKKGWDITLKRELDHDGIVSHVTASGVRLIGLSAGGEHCLPALARLVVALRISAPHSTIMVSGAILNTSHAEVLALGVDKMPESVEEAVQHAHRIWERTFDKARVS